MPQRRCCNRSWQLCMPASASQCSACQPPPLNGLSCMAASAAVDAKIGAGIFNVVSARKSAHSLCGHRLCFDSTAVSRTHRCVSWHADTPTPQPLC